jgi:tetratricopeptide (TPR) repeat protein
MIVAGILVLLLGMSVEAEDCARAQQQLNEVTRALGAGDLSGAERALDSIGSAYQKCAGVRVAVGRLHLGKGDYARANALSEAALLDTPDAPEALLFRGEMLAMQGQIAPAQRLIERACELDPTNPEAHFQLGTILDGRKRNPEAAAEFEKVIKLRPDDPRAYDYLALNLEPQGETSRAEAAYKQGLAVNAGPRFDSFLDYNYGRLLMKLNRLTESKLHLDRALELAQQVRAVYYEHAKLNIRMGKFAEARTDGEKALSLADPNRAILDLQIYSLLATVYTHLGQEQLAQKYVALAQNASVPIRSRDRK